MSWMVLFGRDSTREKWGKCLFAIDGVGGSVVQIWSIRDLLGFFV